jgi:hypothetical protein
MNLSLFGLSKPQRDISLTEPVFYVIVVENIV